MATAVNEKNGQVLYYVEYLPIDKNDFTKKYCEKKTWLTFQKMEVGQIILVNGNKIKVKSIKS